MIKMPLLHNKHPKELVYEINEPVPEHIAIIMDGNGRWAKKRGMPRVAGHKEGISTVDRIVKEAVKYQVKYLTLYTFSTENWKRPKREVDYIFRLPKQFLRLYLPELIENNVRIGTIGDIKHLPAHTMDALEEAIKQTKHNNGLQLNFALNYGGRNEMVQAMKQLLADIKHHKYSVEDLDEELLSEYLYTASIPDPDLLIRTGGEKRLSNFLLWQLAYTEFWFSDVLWPDFTEAEFSRAIEEFQHRKRRFGGI